MIAVREPVNHREEWEPDIVWPSCLLAMTTGNLSRGIRVHLVDVRDTIELGPMIADVTNVQRAGAEYLLLQVKAPRGDIGGAQVRINSEDTTGVALQSGVVAVKTGPGRVNSFPVQHERLVTRHPMLRTWVRFPRPAFARHPQHARTSEE